MAGENLFSDRHTSEDRAQPHERENAVFECVTVRADEIRAKDSSKRENNSRTDIMSNLNTVNKERIASK